MEFQKELNRRRRSLKEIEEATDNFDGKNLIRKGGFGEVYKGNLKVSGVPTDIVARKLHKDYGQGDLEFWNEVSIHIRLNSHDNLVSFIGFCDEDGKKIIITKHEANKSLDQYLNNPTLTWTQRLEICVDVARALKHIHYDEKHDYSVIHRNIKSSKVLLDENWKPKLSGFQLAKATTKARRNRFFGAEISGTIGYVDPTYEKTGLFSHKSDVYSFGVMLFEVMCGKKAYALKEKERPSAPPSSEFYRTPRSE